MGTSAKLTPSVHNKTNVLLAIIALNKTQVPLLIKYPVLLEPTLIQLLPTVKSATAQTVKMATTALLEQLPRSLVLRAFIALNQKELTPTRVSPLLVQMASSQHP